MDSGVCIIGKTAPPQAPPQSLLPDPLGGVNTLAKPYQRPCMILTRHNLKLQYSCRQNSTNVSGLMNEY